MKSTPSEFFDGLKAGDLVAATVASSSKLHLVHVVRRVTAEMVQGQPAKETLLGLFDCRPLCEVRPRYYWRPVDQLESWNAENKCRWCFSRWRSGGRPLIKGWTQPEAVVQSIIQLPWGWHEVTPSGHPLDLPADGPDPEPEEEESKVGSKRVEVRRWVRGVRYVRITRDLADGRHCVRYGATDDKPDEERWRAKGSSGSMLLCAVALMAVGGAAVNGTRYEKLTMRDIARKEA